MTVADAHELLGVPPGASREKLMRHFAGLRNELVQVQPMLNSLRELRLNRGEIQELDQALEIVLQAEAFTAEPAPSQEGGTAAPGRDWWKTEISAEFLLPEDGGGKTRFFSIK